MLMTPYLLRIALSLAFVAFTALQAQSTIDAFDAPHTYSGKKFGGYQSTQLGYVIYASGAQVQLKFLAATPGDTINKALQLSFSLPPATVGANWLSVRREFETPLNLEGYSGVEFKLKVELPARNTLLRITLADTRGGQDELWWFDCEPGTIETKTVNWITIRVPFERFYLSYGAGTRHNDGVFDIRNIIAYEINLVSTAVTNASGVILMDSLQTFID